MRRAYAIKRDDGEYLNSVAAGAIGNWTPDIRRAHLFLKQRDARIWKGKKPRNIHIVPVTIGEVR